MRQLLAFIAAAIRGALRAPIDFLEALYEALRRKHATNASDLAMAEVERAVEQAQAASVEAAPTNPIIVTLEAEVRGALAYTIVNARRSAAGQAPIDGPTISEPRFAEWAARLDSTQAQRVLKALKARPGHALLAHMDRSVRILGVPLILELETYKAMAAAEMEYALGPEKGRRQSAKG